MTENQAPDQLVEPHPAPKRALGATALMVLVPFGRVRFDQLVRPPNSQNVLLLIRRFQELSKEGRLLEIVGSEPVGSITGDFLQEPGPDGPNLAVPLQNECPPVFGTAKDPIFFIVPKPGLQRTQHQAEGACGAPKYFALRGVDGRHRNLALTHLARDPTEKNFDFDTLVLVEVKQITGDTPLSRVEHVLSAVDSNFRVQSARSFMFDEIYAIASVRDAALESFLAEQPLSSTPDTTEVGRSPMSVLTLAAVAATKPKRRCTTSAPALKPHIRRSQTKNLLTGDALTECIDIATSRRRAGETVNPLDLQVMTGSDRVEYSITYLSALLSATAQLTHLHLRLLATASNGEDGGSIFRNIRGYARAGAKGAALPIAPDPLRGLFVSIMRQRLSTASLASVDDRRASSEEPLSTYVAQCEEAIKAAEAGVLVPTDVTISQRDREKGVNAEARTYRTLQRLMPYPASFGYRLEVAAVATSFLNTFCEGVSNRQALKPLLPYSAMRLYATHTCFVHREVGAGGTTALLSSDRSVDGAGSRWVSGNALLEEAKHLVRGNVPGQDEGVERPRLPLIVALRKAAEGLQDSYGWSFALVMGILGMPRIPITSAKDQPFCKTPIRRKEPRVDTIVFRSVVAVLAAWRVALSRLLDYPTLAAAIGPYCTMASSPKPHFNVPVGRSNSLRLAPKSLVLSLIRRSKDETEPVVDTRHVTDWADSIGPVVRATSCGCTGSGQIKESEVAAMVVSDAEEAAACCSTGAGTPAGTITFRGLLNLEARRTGSQARLPGDESEQEEISSMERALKNSLEPTTWSSDMVNRVVDAVIRHPNLQGRRRPEVIGLLLGQQQQQQQEKDHPGQQAGAAGEAAAAAATAEAAAAAATAEAPAEAASEAASEAAAEAAAEPQNQQQQKNQRPRHSNAATEPHSLPARKRGKRGRTFQEADEVPPSKKARSPEPDESTDVWAGPYLEGSDTSVLVRVLDKLKASVLILQGDCTDVAGALATADLKASDQNSLRSRLGGNGKVQIVDFSLALSPSQTLQPSTSKGPPLYGSDYAGVQMVLSDPPYGVRAATSLHYHGDGGDGELPPRTKKKEHHDTALAPYQITEFCQALQRASARWARVAVQLPESRLAEWKDGMCNIQHTRGGEVRSPPESIVIGYDSAAPVQAHKRKRGAKATKPLRSTEFVVNTTVVQAAAAGTSTSRAAADAATAINGMSIDVDSMTAAVNLGGTSMLAGLPTPRDQSWIGGVQRPSGDELITPALKWAFGARPPEVARGTAVEADGPLHDHAALRPEQKSEFLIAELLDRLRPKSVSASTVYLDPFAGVLTTAVASLTLGSHASVVVSDKHTDVLDAGKNRVLIRALYLALVGGGSFQDFQPTPLESEILCRTLAQAVARTASIIATKHRDWGSLPGGDGPLPSFCKMPEHMSSFFLATSLRSPPKDHPFFDPLLFATANKAVSGDSALRKAAFDADANRWGCYVAESRTVRDASGKMMERSVFAARDFNAGEVVTPFYGAYSFQPGTRNGYRKWRYDGLHSEEATNVKYAMETDLPTKLPVWGSKGHMWVTPAAFSVAAYVNDPRKKVETPEEEAANVTARAPTLQWLKDVVDADNEEEAARKGGLLQNCTSESDDDTQLEAGVHNYYSERLPPPGWTVQEARKMPLFAARELLMSANCVELVAKRKICKGDEVLLNYGRNHHFS